MIKFDKQYSKISLRGDSNPRPMPYQGIALPAEPLRREYYYFITMSNLIDVYKCFL